LVDQILERRRTYYRGGEKLRNVLILVGKLEEKKPHERPRHKWEENIKVGLKAVGCVVMNWLHFVQNKVQWQVFVNTALNIRVP
jgi:hypothetical protein